MLVLMALMKLENVVFVHKIFDMFIPLGKSLCIQCIHLESWCAPIENHPADAHDANSSCSAVKGLMTG